MIELKILGQKISLGDISLEQLKELRGKLKESGAPELLFDTEWLNRQSIIPQRTMRNVRGIPPTAGFARSTSPQRRVIPIKVSEPPIQVKVEEDTLFNEEFQLISELTSVLEECLVAFPENKNIEIRAAHSSMLGGCKGTYKGNSIIILFVPDQAWGQWKSLKPIIYHELAHFIGKNSEETERIFFERADEKSKEMWRKLKSVDAINCEQGLKDKEDKGG